MMSRNSNTYCRFGKTDVTLVHSSVSPTTPDAAGAANLDIRVTMRRSESARLWHR